MIDSETSAVLEHIRRLAIHRLAEGHSQKEVAEFLERSPRTIRRWWRVWRSKGEAALPPQGGGGRPPKLDDTQIKQVLEWLE